MPFYDLGDEDLTAIISYLRASQPVRNPVPAHDWNLLGKAVKAFGMIKPVGDGDVPPAPQPGATAEYGRYLASTVANCRGCHTDRDMKTGEYTGTDYAGQLVMDVVGQDGQTRYLVSPNLTPDPKTGRIAYWTLSTFIARFRKGAAIPDSPMPWGSFTNMTDLELTALFTFLKSLDPVVAELPTPVGLQAQPPVMP
jgi:hypothetical protein